MKKTSIILLTVLFLIGCQSGPQLSPEELKEKWQAPVVTSAFLVGICEGVTDTAQKVQDEEIDGFSAFGELLAAGAMIQAMDESLAEAEPAADQAEFVSQMQADIEAMKSIIGPWIDDETTSADVLAEIGPVCTSTTETFDGVVTAASDDGLTAEMMEQMLDDAAAAMESAVPAEE